MTKRKSKAAPVTPSSRGGPWVYRDGELVTKDEAHAIDARKSKSKATLDWLPKFAERGCWVLIDGELVLKTHADAVRRAGRAANRSSLAAPALRSDTVEVKSMVDGKVYDSKTRYYKHLKDTGHEIVEKVEPQATTRAVDRPEYKKGLIEDISEAYDKVEQGWEGLGQPLKDAADFGLSSSQVAADDSGYVRAEHTPAE